MKKLYIEPDAELVVMRLEAPLCESDLSPLTDLEGFGDALDLIW
jgi:hypothetical protein